MKSSISNGKDFFVYYNPMPITVTISLTITKDHAGKEITTDRIYKDIPVAALKEAIPDKTKLKVGDEIDWSNLKEDQYAYVCKVVLDEEGRIIRNNGPAFISLSVLQGSVPLELPKTVPEIKVSVWHYWAWLYKNLEVDDVLNSLKMFLRIEASQSAASPQIATTNKRHAKVADLFSEASSTIASTAPDSARSAIVAGASATSGKKIKVSTLADKEKTYYMVDEQHLHKHYHKDHLTLMREDTQEIVYIARKYLPAPDIETYSSGPC